MIPDELRMLIARQSGETRRTRRDIVMTQLQELGIDPNSEFGEFFRHFKVSALMSPVSPTDLRALAEPTTQIARATDFARDCWELPSEYVCISSTEGEGAYLYNIKTGAVVDFDLAKRKEFLGPIRRRDGRRSQPGRVTPVWRSILRTSSVFQ